jgi:hypothetical protein
VKQTTQYHTETYKGVDFQHCTQICGEDTVRTCDAWKDGVYLGRVYYRAVSKNTFFWELFIVGYTLERRFTKDTKEEYFLMVERLKEEVTK